MALTPNEIFNISTKDYILGNATPQEQTDFISDQIKKPFNSGSSNYFKKLKSMVTADELDEICVKLLNEVEDQYPNIGYDLDDHDERPSEIFSVIYKFFVKNIDKLMYIFLREYISNSKNRKVLIVDHMNVTSYPKEQYGKKEFYILITKLPAIIDDIMEANLTLEKFIDWICRSTDDTPLYLTQLKEYIDNGLIYDHGIVTDIFNQFKESSKYDNIICKLQMSIKEDIIDPYLIDNGLIDLRMPTVTEEDPDITDDEEEDTTNGE